MHGSAHSALWCGICNYVDGTAECRKSELAHRSAAQNFDAFNDRKIDRNIEVGVTRLCVGNVHTIEEN